MLVVAPVAHAGERVRVDAALELHVAPARLTDYAVEHLDVLALVIELGRPVRDGEARGERQELREALADVLEARDEGVVVVGVLRADGLEVPAGEVLGEHAPLLHAGPQEEEALGEGSGAGWQPVELELGVLGVVEQRVHVAEQKLACLIIHVPRASSQSFSQA